MTKDYKTHHININGAERDLRLFEVAPGVTIAILNILGDTGLVQAASKGLSDKLAGTKFDVIVTAEAVDGQRLIAGRKKVNHEPDVVSLGCLGDCLDFV